ncbi:hypothetical protein XENTR_v10012938 [Xenopus tropicalis]|nr:hypothetical protein XENTR_v10012938 [Xenopus tropicalis]
MGRCDTEEDSEGFDERNLRPRSEKNMDSSDSDSSMVPQEMLLPPTPAEGTTR